ncbi:hypothetical protein KEM55_002246 [Ascosphaera atra]|nr:hypothetical protein KEM55_002246 [Ascosphaera atra]
MAFFSTLPSLSDSGYGPLFHILDDYDYDYDEPSYPIYPVRQLYRRANPNSNNNRGTATNNAVTHTANGANGHPDAHQTSATPSKTGNKATAAPATRSAMPAASFIRSFAPRFDVRETKDAYLLDGELPGLKQSDVDMEFTDAHTLVVKGMVKRHYDVVSPSEKEKEHHEDDDAASVKSSGSNSSHQATVEDADDEEDELCKNKNKKAEKKSTVATSKPAQQAQAQAPMWKYWASERAIGSFHRTFNFPGRVNQDEVKASLRDGILSVVVPKEAEKKTAKKIFISSE